MRSKICMQLKIGIILHNGSITQRIYETQRKKRKMTRLKIDPNPKL